MNGGHSQLAQALQTPEFRFGFVADKGLTAVRQAHVAILFDVYHYSLRGSDSENSTFEVLFHQGCMLGPSSRTE